VPGVPVVLPPRHAARTWGSLPTLFPSGVTGPGGPPGRHHRHTVRPPTVPRVDRHRNRHVRAATHSHTPATGERARSRRQLAVWPAWSCSRRLGARRATLPRRHRPRQAGRAARRDRRNVTSVPGPLARKTECVRARPLPWSNARVRGTRGRARRSKCPSGPRPTSSSVAALRPGGGQP
jgi:hypothetical protein